MPTGRRERNKEEKLARIAETAARLFDELGFASVTTQRIADEADVAAGTVFRYASTKAELLMMVDNERSKGRIAKGLAADDPALPAARRILAIVTPLVRAGRDNDENTLAYQRELLFGEQHERYRAEGLALFGELREHMAAILADAWMRRNDAPAPDPAAAARALSAALHLAIADAAVRGTPTRILLADLAADFEVIARGYETTPTTSDTTPNEGQEET